MDGRVRGMRRGGCATGTRFTCRAQCCAPLRLSPFQRLSGRPDGCGSAQNVLHFLDVKTPFAGILRPRAGVAARAEPVFRPWRRIMSGTDDLADKASPEAKPSAEDGAHTAGGAPTDQAHQDAGDGTLAGSVPAGLSLKQ